MSAIDARNPAQRQTLWLLACAAIVMLQVVIMYWMGRIPICECGYVKLFEPVATGPGNSQHLADWYTPSHIIHGFLFYGLAHLVLRRRPIAARMLLALVIEVGWELLENSPIIIDRYRTATISLDYYGDSILNSVADVAAMMLGFWLAARAPIAVTIALFLVFEAFVGYMIRDNLLLNILMLVYPVEWIRAWQAR